MKIKEGDKVNEEGDEEGKIERMLKCKIKEKGETKTRKWNVIEKKTN